MKHYVLPIVAILTVGLTALVLPLVPASAKSTPRASSPKQPSPQQAAQTNEPVLEREAQRWLRGHATHWRDCMLQP
jgi:hypothetical protein